MGELFALQFDRHQNSQTFKDLNQIIHFSQTFNALKMADDFLHTFKGRRHPALISRTGCNDGHNVQNQGNEQRQLAEKGQGRKSKRTK